MTTNLARAIAHSNSIAPCLTTVAVLLSIQGCTKAPAQPTDRSATSSMSHTSSQHSHGSHDAPIVTSAASTEDWKAAEAAHLVNVRQLTFPRDYVRAGEAYFDPTSEWVIFQAVARPTPGVEADPFYAMYVGKLMRAEPEGKVNVNEGTGTHFALMNSQRISPQGSANTCGWFHPTKPGMIIMGSTLGRPADEQKSGFQVGTRRYVWMFPDEMEVVTLRSREMTKQSVESNELEDTAKNSLPPSEDALRELQVRMDKQLDSLMVKSPITPLFSRPKYDAECSYDKSGRFVIYTHVEENSPEGKPDGNLYIYDTKTQKHHPIVIDLGYDGGPFFSPDGKSICYRSDRKGNDLLQLFVADLKFVKDTDGTMIPVGIEREWQITNDENVNWAPYWHPDGKTLVYASSAVAHTNYEVFAITLDWNKLRSLPKDADAATSAATCTPWRVTHAPGADVLPAFSPDGKWLMWTSQRGEKLEGEAKSSSQLWIAEWKN